MHPQLCTRRILRYQTHGISFIKTWSTRTTTCATTTPLGTIHAIRNMRGLTTRPLDPPQLGSVETVHVSRHQEIFQQALSRLTIKNLSALLFATGQPVSGLKPDLTKRLSTYLASIMDRLDALPHSCNSLDTKSLALTANDSSPENVAVDQMNRKTTSVSLDDPRVKEAVYNLLPQSIVSIDIGMRNLAWVELARDGRILRWSVEDLMAPAETDSSLPSNGIGPAVETPIEATEQTDLGATEPESKKRGAKAKYTLKIKTDSIAYNPREVALRVDRVMSNIVNSETLEGIVLEQQRFRSGGFHAVLDVTIKCSIIEGMIHTWVALWQQRWAQQHSNSVAGQYSREGEPIYIESVPPKAVGSWWSEEGNKVRDAWEVPSRKKRGAKNAELDKVSNQDIPETIESEVQKRPSPSSAYQAKKRRARAIVDSWINVEDKVETAHCSMQGIDQKMVPLKLVSRSNVDCPPELKEWYCMERKRDDLSDCLLQAVAWYEWKQRAIKEAIELSHKLENESNTPVKARS